MSAYETLRAELKKSSRTWLVTGAAGFIGSNLVEALLKLDQRVVGLDNFATGHRKNLNQLKDLVTASQWERFRFLDADLRVSHLCHEACTGVDYVLHQGALGSVPRSVADPVTSNEANVLGFLNIMLAARDAKVKRLVYASSSSVYGDHPDLPKVEDKVGNVLSPYAATKKFNEIYADVFARTYGFKAIGLRYFNVFGPRQDPDGAYAAVMPKWVASLLKKEPVFINGDGETSRDFCYVENVVQANLLAATTQNEDALNQAYNIAVGDRTTLNDLYRAIHDGLRRRNPALPEQKPTYREFRVGDVRHSLANVDKARRLLGYAPTHTMPQGLELALDWYVANVG
jgi:UDP-N-acetylglucosamine/UDP-N-acetylgalactosamine 4-epimerase